MGFRTIGWSGMRLSNNSVLLATRGSNLAVFMVCSVLFGCAAGPVDTKGSATESVAPTSFAEMQYSPLKLDAEQPVELRDKSPTFAFPQGESHYAALSLPKHNATSFLAVRIFVTHGLGLLPDASGVRPHFAFLNADHVVLLTVVDVPLWLGTEFFRGPFFRGEVAIPAESAYVVVYSSNTPLPVLTVYSENGTPWPVRPDRTGKLYVEVKSKS